MALDKKRQREELRKIASLNAGADPKAVVDKLAERLVEFGSARVVAAYMALTGEVDLNGLFSKIDQQWAFPKVVGDQLKFYRVRDFVTDFATGSFGIPEPLDGLDEIPIHEIDVFLCPGLGFDRHGGRMGRGKGFYDRILAKANSSAKKIGVCFPFQIVDKITTDEWDVKMDEVVY